jgi:hypothetical protein
VIEKLGDRVPETAAVSKHQHSHAVAVLPANIIEAMKQTVNNAQRGQIKQVPNETLTLSADTPAGILPPVPSPTPRIEALPPAGSESQGPELRA